MTTPTNRSGGASEPRDKSARATAQPAAETRPATAGARPGIQPGPDTLGRALARFNTAFYWVFILWILAGVPFRTPWWLLFPVAILLLLIASAKTPLRSDSPITTNPPVRGQWAALNSPASKVPSHGTRIYGQSHAIDILRASTTGEQLKIGWTRGFRKPESFESFGEPVYVVKDGTVIRIRDGWRDHRSRSSIPALLYLMIVEQFRILGGFGAVGGNHVVVDHHDGTYSAYGHLKKGSIQVASGDHIRAGEQLGLVGNSGNSTEPHLHFQLMDRPLPNAASGLDFRWSDTEVEPGLIDDHWPADKVTQEVTPGLAANGQVFQAR